MKVKAMKEFTLVEFPHKKFLFTSNGYNDQIAFAEMRVFRFFNDKMSFHIFAISETLHLVFGDDLSFFHWLVERGVKSEEHKILRYAVVEPMSKMKDLVCATEDNLLVKISISSLNFTGVGTITTQDKEPKLVYQFSLGTEDFLPLLTKLKDEKPKVLWNIKSENSEEPAEVKRYYEALEQQEKSDNLTGIIGLIVIVAVVVYIIYSIFAE